MKEQTKKIWDGTIKSTIEQSLGGAFLRTSKQEFAKSIVEMYITSATKLALVAALKEAKQVTENNLWSDIDIKVTIEIAPQKKTEEL